jgi:hypothetical protein
VTGSSEGGIDGWLVLAVAATVMAIAGVLDAVWRAAHGHPGGLIVLPIGLAFWAWIAGGALRRRARRQAPTDATT